MTKKQVEGLLKEYFSGYLKLRAKRDEEAELQYEVIDLFMKNLKELKEIDYRILVMVYREEQSWELLASHVMLSVSQCHRRKNKMINKLKTMLQGVGF